MKRLLTIFCLSTILCNLSATNVITTRASERIDAIVLDISDTVVKYKLANNSSGPTYEMPISEVYSISYQSGKVQIFKEVSSGLIVCETHYHNTSVETPGVILTNSVKFIPGQMISKLPNSYKYGDVQMDNSNYVLFLDRNCPEAAEVYKKGITNLQWGITLTSTSAGFLLGLGVLEIIFAINGNADAGGLFALGFCAPVALCTAIGVPLWVKGNKQIKRSLDIFNSQCVQIEEENSLSLSLNASQNGIGVALNF